LEWHTTDTSKNETKRLPFRLFFGNLPILFQ
jgi:hypothetical protein